jgi:GntR family transcriptional repressor for pyruvate dehydrogenase complex
VAILPEAMNGDRVVADASAPAGGAELFRAIDREDTLAMRVSREIERLIVERRLPTGHRMLSERELGERFGVSRTVIREAVRALAAKGLLAVRTGDGTYVMDSSHATAAEALGRLLRLAGARSPRQVHAVYEVRRPLEVAIAALAAERATAADVERLAGLVEKAGQQELDEAAYIEADVAFHLALAEATGNHLFVALLNSVSDLMAAIREVGVAVVPREQGWRQHRKLLERIAAHDVEGARRAMAEHMDHSERILERAVQEIEA